MCLITFAYKTHPDYHLILAANRDEFHSRPTQSAQFWEDNSTIVGGKDLKAGGSWLALNTNGRFAAVTNFREGITEPSEQSRGDLVTSFLTATDSLQQFSDSLLASRHRYSGYNLLLGTSDELFYTSNRTDLATPLSPGYYSLSNHLLDTPWPKSLYVKQALRNLLAEQQPTPKKLIDMMGHRRQFEDHLLPSTGIGIERERTLSPPFIDTPEYGTRCSSVVLWKNSGKILLAEQSYFAAGKAGSYQEYSLTI